MTMLVSLYLANVNVQLLKNLSACHHSLSWRLQTMCFWINHKYTNCPHTKMEHSRFCNAFKITQRCSIEDIYDTCVHRSPLFGMTLSSRTALPTESFVVGSNHPIPTSKLTVRRAMPMESISFGTLPWGSKRHIYDCSEALRRAGRRLVS